MKIAQQYWAASLAFRRYITAEYLKYHGPTNAKAAETLCGLAYQLKLRDSEKAIPGSTLLLWKDGSVIVPYWACLVMLNYVVRRGFEPCEEGMLNSIACFIGKDLSPKDTSNALIGMFPKIDKETIEASVRRIEE
ncbi:hypothetical protein KW507_15980 [Vibrio fluvialis]|nr:hypothetical protein [Vibrio fluvialis]